MKLEHTRAVKTALSNWGYHMNGDKAPKELKIKGQAIFKDTGGSRPVLELNDETIEDVARSLGGLILIDEKAYGIISRLYFHRDSTSQAMNFLNLKKSAFYEKRRVGYEHIAVDALNLDITKKDTVI